MTENRFEQFLKDAAQDYNRPPEIAPREEMWTRIQDAQRANASAPLLRVEDGRPQSERSFVQRTQWWALAAAAGILLVAGIGIGRMTGSNSTTRVAVAKTSAPSAPAPVTVAPVDSTVVAVASSPEPGLGNAGERPTPVSRGAARLASGPSISIKYPRPRRSTLEIDANRMNATYQVASLRHLAETEALLTAFRTDSAGKAMDPVVAKWSRDLLSNTRLLLDSPAARDPLRKHLFEDLELVLTQIVQLSNAPNANERDMVESTIREGHVMTRLRTAIPAGRPQGS